MARVKGALTERQRLFVDKLFELQWNQTQAALAAGITSGNAYISRLMRLPGVKAEIARRQAVLREKVQVDEAFVVGILARAANAGSILAKYRVRQKDGSLTWDFTGAPQEDLAVITEMSNETYMEGRGDDAREVKRFKIGMDSPKAAADSLARYLGLFKDKLEVSGEGSLVDRLSKGRDRVRKSK